MKYLLLFGFLLLAIVAGAQDQLRVQNGKTFNCKITNVYGPNIIYIDARDTTRERQVSLNLIEFLYIQDTIQAQRWAAENKTFGLVYHSRAQGREVTKRLSAYQLLTNAGEKQHRGYRRIIGSVVVTNLGAIGGVVLTETSLLAAGLLTGGAGLIGIFMAVNGYYLLMDAAIG